MRNCYTYLLGWSKLDSWYYGCRWSENCDPSDLWVIYKTSSKHVKNFTKEHGDPDIIQVRKIFGDDVIGVQLYEHKVLKRMKVDTDIRWINRGVGTPKHSQPGLWYNNGKIDIRSIEHPGEGWFQGSLTHDNIGCVWWNNATHQTHSHTSPGGGWVEGMLPKPNYKYEWYSNGTNSKQVLEGDTPPEGWIRGYTPKGKYKKWFWCSDEEGNRKIYGDPEKDLPLYMNRYRITKGKSWYKQLEQLPDAREYTPTER